MTSSRKKCLKQIQFSVNQINASSKQIKKIQAKYGVSVTRSKIFWKINVLYSESNSRNLQIYHDDCQYNPAHSHSHASVLLKQVFVWSCTVTELWDWWRICRVLFLVLDSVYERLYHFLAVCNSFETLLKSGGTGFSL